MKNPKNPSIDEWIDGPEIQSFVVASYGGMANDWQYVVGVGGVTRIERTFKSGMHASIPYVRVWKGDKPAAEFCEHSIVGVMFADNPVEA